MESQLDHSLILPRIQSVQARIHAACERVGRLPSEVELVLVSKTQPPEAIRSALAAGIICFGENKAQELKRKAEELRDTPIQWHFIGHLQSNKIKDILPWVSMMQSLDSLALAEKLQARLAPMEKTLEVLIQVNTSYEDQKSGVLPEAALELIQRCAQLDRLKLRGLMTIGLLSAEENKVRDCFKRLKALQDKAQALNLPQASFDLLSMGMSGDFEWAIEEGATMIRLGTTIFGGRLPIGGI